MKNVSYKLKFKAQLQGAFIYPNTDWSMTFIRCTVRNPEVEIGFHWPNYIKPINLLFECVASSKS